MSICNTNEVVQKIILSERYKYDAIYEAIERFILENNLIIHDILAIKLLLGEGIDHNCFVYSILTLNAKRYSRKLHECLRELNDSATLQEVVVGLTYLIKISGRLIVRIESIRSVDYNYLFDIGKEVLSYYSNRIRVGHYSLLLSNIFGSLYDFSKMGDWHELVEKSKSVISLYKKEATPIYKYQSYADDKILDEFIVNNEDVMLCTDHVLAFFKEGEYTTVPGILSTLHDDTISAALSKILKTEVISKLVKLSACDDSRIVKVTFYANNRAILIKYNFLDYDIINYGMFYDDKGSFIKIANIFCILRLICINIQILFWHTINDPQKAQIFRDNISLGEFNLFRMYDALFECGIIDQISNPSSTLYMYNAKNIMGTYKNEDRYNNIIKFAK